MLFTGYLFAASVPQVLLEVWAVDDVVISIPAATHSARPKRACFSRGGPVEVAMCLLDPGYFVLCSEALFRGGILANIENSVSECQLVHNEVLNKPPVRRRSQTGQVAFDMHFTLQGLLGKSNGVKDPVNGPGNGP